MTQPTIVRALLGLGALLSMVFVIYASLVPLNYTPKPYDETMEIFRNTPWFQLGIERRADWVANGLILLPSGFLAAGAVDWRRERRWLLLFASPLIIAILVSVVFTIEFVQIWFPPRVVSQNDIFAGVIGSFGGVLMWWLGGRAILGQLEQFLVSPAGLTKWKLLMNFGILGLLIYNLMPMDVLVSSSEFQKKWAMGGINLIPFQDFHADRKSILLLGIAGLRAVPFAFVTALAYGVSRSTVIGLGVAVLLEVVKIPIQSRSASVTDVVASAIGVVLAACGASTAMHFIRLLDRSLFWFFGAVSWTGLMLVGFLSRFSSIERDPVVLKQRMQGILTVPFARAHSSSEFEAGENILIKIVVFGTLAFLLSGWISRAKNVLLGRAVVFMSILWCVGLALSIEIAQVYLPPLVPDVTDFILYGIGIVVGIVGFKMMIPLPNGERVLSKKFNGL